MTTQELRDFIAQQGWRWKETDEYEVIKLHKSNTYGGER